MTNTLCMLVYSCRSWHIEKKEVFCFVKIPVLLIVDYYQMHFNSGLVEFEIGCHIPLEELESLNFRSIRRNII